MYEVSLTFSLRMDTVRIMQKGGFKFLYPEKFPHLLAWRDALLAASAVKASTVPNIEAVWQEGLITRKRGIKKYVAQSVLGADAAA